ncbi:hypothetical protein [Natronobeatus ordinarius]|nr:hypothetical protein [Natronobeatus ordinarius]
MSRNCAIEPTTLTGAGFTDLLAERGTAVNAGFLAGGRRENLEGVPRLES